MLEVDTTVNTSFPVSHPVIQAVFYQAALGGYHLLLSTLLSAVCLYGHDGYRTPDSTGNQISFDYCRFAPRSTAAQEPVSSQHSSTQLRVFLLSTAPVPTFRYVASIRGSAIGLPDLLVLEDPALLWTHLCLLLCAFRFQTCHKGFTYLRL